jgi:hypothetical protein
MQALLPPRGIGPGVASLNTIPQLAGGLGRICMLLGSIVQQSCRELRRRQQMRGALLTDVVFPVMNLRVSCGSKRVHTLLAAAAVGLDVTHDILSQAGFHPCCSAVLLCAASGATAIAAVLCCAASSIVASLYHSGAALSHSDWHLLSKSYACIAQLSTIFSCLSCNLHITQLR